MDTSAEGTTAILVEDELLVALHVEELLEDLGLKVVGVAARVSDALRLLKTSGGVDLVVLDMNLSGEKSWPIARECRRLGVPFIFVTGYLLVHADLPDDLSDALLLPKPLDPAQLASAIARVLGSCPAN